MAKKKVVLAYSGGLDTSCITAYLVERDYEVVCLMIDVGQNQKFAPAVARAKKAGAAKVIVSDQKEKFVRDYVWPALKANAIYENRYVLATALSRPLIAEELVRVAEEEKADCVGHGCTGKGNDQVRIEMGVHTLNPDLEILAPVREWEFRSRGEEIAYCLKRGIPIDVTRKSPYSTDENLWGVSIECGVLEDPWHQPPADCYVWTKGSEKRMLPAKEISIDFERGIPVALNGKKKPALELIRELNTAGALYGIGRMDMIENRFVGIKSREVYETPAAAILLAAHRDLEALVLDKMTTQFKDELAHRYARLIYEGYWFTPLKRSLDLWINETQKRVSGTVKVRLLKNAVQITARKSPKHSLYREALATYTEKDRFDPSLAKGFIRITGLPYRGMKPGSR